MGRRGEGDLDVDQILRLRRTPEAVAQQQTSPELDLQVIVKNYVTHKHTKVKAWLARS